MQREVKDEDTGIVMKANDSKGREFLSHFINARKRRKEIESKFKDYLKSIGVKAWHYRDGWHSKDNKSFIFPSYVRFNDGVRVGDLVCLGWWDNFTKDFWIVRVSDIETISGGSKRYYYDDIIKKYPNQNIYFAQKKNCIIHKVKKILRKINY